MRKNFFIHSGRAALTALVTALMLSACGSSASSSGKETAAGKASEGEDQDDVEEI